MLRATTSTCAKQPPQPIQPPEGPTWCHSFVARSWAQLGAGQTRAGLVRAMRSARRRPLARNNPPLPPRRAPAGETVYLRAVRRTLSLRGVFDCTTPMRAPPGETVYLRAVRRTCAQLGAGQTRAGLVRAIWSAWRRPLTRNNPPPGGPRPAKQFLCAHLRAVRRRSDSGRISTGDLERAEAPTCAQHPPPGGPQPRKQCRCAQQKLP